MKELQDNKAKRVELNIRKDQKTQVKIATLRPHKGHACFQLKVDTGEITLAEFEQTDVHFLAAQKPDFAVKKKVLVKEGCLYVTALNKKNARKQFMKMLIPFFDKILQTKDNDNSSR